MGVILLTKEVFLFVCLFLILSWFIWLIRRKPKMSTKCIHIRLHLLYCFQEIFSLKILYWERIFFCGSIIRSCTYFYDFMGALGLLFSKLSAELTCSLSSIRIVWYNAGGCAWSLCSAFPLAVQCWASDDDGKWLGAEKRWGFFLFSLLWSVKSLTNALQGCGMYG